MLAAAGLPASGHVSHCSPSRSGYSTQQLLEMRQQATRMAVSLKSCGDEEMMRAAITSSDHRHRVAAAFALGMGHKHDESLLMLMEDQNPLVVQAAREAATHICAVKFKQPAADFGPFPGADASNRTDSAGLWRLYFDKQTARLSPGSSSQAAKAGLPEAPKREASPANPGKESAPLPIGFVSHGEADARAKNERADPAAKTSVREVSYDDDSIPGMRIRRVTLTPVPSR
ncbi:MAG: hypothetical protein FJ261_08760 [Planctomycetes bacterium]|nr:hypothetical protein [Planctomycetota bacterium]